MLEINMFQMSSDELIVGLSDIEPLQPYMISVSRSYNERQLQLRQLNKSTQFEEVQELLLISWRLQYLWVE